MEKYLNLSEEQLYEKISFIQQKLDRAYSTSVGQEYIDFLYNEIQLIQSIMDEKEFMKTADKESGIVFDTIDPDGKLEKTIKQEEQSKEDKKENKKFSMEKFIKVYKNND